MDKKETLLSQSLAVRTFPLNEVKQLCDNFSIEHHHEVAKPKSNIVDWLAPMVDLSEFKHFYPANGVTEGLNYWMMQESRSIQVKDGEYAWVEGKQEGDVHYISCPSSVDGNFCEIPTDKPVVLDLAYIGSTKIGKLDIPKNVEKVFFSLSKSFGLRNYRIGYYWSRRADPMLEKLIYSAKYYNYYSFALGEKIIDQFPIDFVHGKLGHIQRDLCKELDLNPSDSLWLATTTDQAYNKFKRGDTNRVCLSGLIEKAYYDKSI
jgi:hypothetical protein